MHRRRRYNPDGVADVIAQGACLRRTCHRGVRHRRLVSPVESIRHFPDHRPAHRRRSRSLLNHWLVDPGWPHRFAQLAERPIHEGSRQHRDRDDRTKYTCNGLRRHTQNSSSLPTPTWMIARKPTPSNQQVIVAFRCLTATSGGATQNSASPSLHLRKCSWWCCAISDTLVDVARPRQPPPSSSLYSSFDCNNHRRACQKRLRVLHCVCSPNTSRSPTVSGAGCVP